MNSDRELLELAARAAGVKLHPMEIITHEREVEFVGFMTDPAQWPRGWWNPLTDSGDALRLAVKLRLGVIAWDDSVSATIGKSNREISVLIGTDPVAAACRAITLAAAEIQRLRDADNASI